MADKSERSKTTLAQRATIVAAISIGMAANALLAMLAMLARPIADDYKYFVRVRRHGLVGGIADLMQLETGRYSQVALVESGYWLFGARSVQVLPLLELLALIAACAFAAWTFLPFAPALRVPAAIAVGLCVVPVTILGMPSTFDSFLWLTSSTVYLPPIACSLAGWAAVAVVLRRRSRALSWRGLAAGAAVVLFIGQGFAEPVAIVNTLIAVGLFLQFTRRGRRTNLAFGGILLAACIAGDLLSASAGGLARRLASRSTDPLTRLTQGLTGIPKDFGRYLSMTPWWIPVAMLAIALLVATCCDHDRLRTVAPQFVAIGVLGVVLPAAISYFVTRFGFDYSALRTFAVPAFATCLGLVLAFVGLVAFIPEPWFLSQVTALAPACVVLMMVASLAMVPTGSRIARAESLRGAMMDTRDAYTNLQLVEGRKQIDILPAPVLLYASEATDFEFAAKQSHGYFEYGYRAWFEIGRDHPFRFLQQPAGYCTTTGVRWEKRAKTCSQLAKGLQRHR